MGRQSRVVQRRVVCGPEERKGYYTVCQHCSTRNVRLLTLFHGEPAFERVDCPAPALWMPNDRHPDRCRGLYC